MVQKQWFIAVPGILLLFGFGRRAAGPQLPPHDSIGRIVDADFHAVEKQAGHHVYAPTWLPEGTRLGHLGTLVGARRIMIDYNTADDRGLCILAQERRTPARDRYHATLFIERNDAQAPINGSEGYFVTGVGGERRLYWTREDASLILSSGLLTDVEMVKIARAIR